MLRSSLLHHQRHVRRAAAASCVALLCLVEEQQQEPHAVQVQEHESPSRQVPQWPRPVLTWSSSPSVTMCHSAFAPSSFESTRKHSSSKGAGLQRQRTMELFQETKKQSALETAYDMSWDEPLGVGTFGNVYQGRNRRTNQPVAVKKISKQFTSNETFVREMDVLLHLERSGGHPSICLLQEHFDEGDDYFYLVFDLVQGGELFDQLCEYGAYSEVDAARMVRQIASALCFLHGEGIVHSDLKPENLMLSSTNKDEATIKIVDFGCAHHVPPEELPGGKNHGKKKNKKQHHDHDHRGTGLTPAYCPPEVLGQLKETPGIHADIEPSYDMWSLGVILYILLTGVHPFDMQGGASGAEMEELILSDAPLPIRRNKHTRHMSKDAKALLERLMERDPEKRMTAEELLQNSWVQGTTASSATIKGSDQRLAVYRRNQTKIGSSIFKGLLSQANRHGGSEFAKRTSILEMAFRDLDPTQRGYISTKELNGVTSFFASDARLSLSEVQELLKENMVPKLFKKGELIYDEGTKGDAMFFLHSGTVEVTSKDGFRTVRQTGEFFGEDALMHDKQTHMQKVVAQTPVHVLEISREYFDKYLKADRDVELTMAETDKLRQRERAKILFGLQKDLRPRKFKRGNVIFEEGSKGDNLYILESGHVDISVVGRKVRSLHQGEMTGEHAAYYQHKPYNVTAKCLSADCTMQVLDGRKIRKLCQGNPDLSQSFKEVILRRDFKKAVVKATGRDFPEGEEEMKDAFALIDKNGNGEVSFDTLKSFIIEWDPEYTDDDVREMLRSLDLGKTGTLTWEVFRRIFSMFNET